MDNKNISIMFIPDYRYANPYQTLLTKDLKLLGYNVIFDDSLPFRKIINKKYDLKILHIHWIKPFIAPKNSNIYKFYKKILFSILKLFILKLTGIKIVWTIHNIAEHESTYWYGEMLFNFTLAFLCEKLFVHSESAKKKVCKNAFLKWFAKKLIIIPHGNYIGYYENNVNKTLSRKHLGIEGKLFVFLHLGAIREYKGLDKLLEAFEGIKNPDIRLVLAGKVYQKSYENKIRAFLKDNRIIYNLEFIEDINIQYYMNAADIVVCTYNSVLTSGNIILAMSFARPIIAPKIGTIPDYLDSKGAFLYASEDPKGLKDAMCLAIDRKESLKGLGQHNFGIIKNYDWERIAKVLSEQYFKVLNYSLIKEVFSKIDKTYV
jgi:glycosyltransferase involved in cell wall biosynthesis